MEHLTVLPQEMEIEFLHFMHALHLLPAHALDNNPDLMIGEATDDLLALEAAFRRRRPPSSTRALSATPGVRMPTSCGRAMSTADWPYWQEATCNSEHREPPRAATNIAGT